MSLLTLNVMPGGDIYLVGVATPIGKDEWGLGWSDFHVAFRWISDGWERLPLERLPEDVRPNLLARTYTYFVEGNGWSGSHVDLKLKSAIDSPITTNRFDPYRTIRRFKVTPRSN
jgi:hypothetical protein